jgi:hypothetical protein
MLEDGSATIYELKQKFYELGTPPPEKVRLLMDVEGELMNSKNGNVVKGRIKGVLRDEDTLESNLWIKIVRWISIFFISPLLFLMMRRTWPTSTLFIYRKENVLVLILSVHTKFKKAGLQMNWSQR